MARVAKSTLANRDSGRVQALRFVPPACTVDQHFARLNVAFVTGDRGGPATAATLAAADVPPLAACKMRMPRCRPERIGVVVHAGAACAGDCSYHAYVMRIEQRLA